MSTAEYQIEWLAAGGQRIDWLPSVGPFEYTKALNFEGDFSLTLPPDFPFSTVAKDQRIRFQRRPPNGALLTDFDGLVRDWESRQIEGGYRDTIMGPGMGWLLSSRRVAYYAGHASAVMTDQADDMMLEIVRDNLGADALTANGRKLAGNISSSYFTVQAGAGAGPNITLNFSYNNVLDMVNKISDAARQSGTSAYWSVVPSGDGFDVRVNLGQLGQDRTTGQYALTFGPEFGNFVGGKLAYKSRQEVNRVYALGQGDGANRAVQTAEDTARSGASIWAVREDAVEDASLTTTTALTNRANAAVLAGRPFYALQGEIVSTDETQYGRDWNLGDKVNVSFHGVQLTALIRAVHVVMDDNSREAVTGALELITS